MLEPLDPPELVELPERGGGADRVGWDCGTYVGIDGMLDVVPPPDVDDPELGGGGGGASLVVVVRGMA